MNQPAYATGREAIKAAIKSLTYEDGKIDDDAEVVLRVIVEHLGRVQPSNLDHPEITNDQVECAAAAACSFHTNQKWSEVTNEWKQFYRANARAGLEALVMVSPVSEDKNMEHA